MPVPASHKIITAGDSFYRSFQRPAPPLTFTVALAAVCALTATYLYVVRVRVLRRKFHDAWSGSTRITAYLSAYMDHYGHDAAWFATLKVWTKCLGFLAFLQWRFHTGFVVMWSVLTMEATLDIVRVYFAYRMTRVGDLAATVRADEQIRRQHKKQEQQQEQQQEPESTTLDVTNVYEDLTRPLALAIIVFFVQAILIGLIMLDTYVTTSRTCFHFQDDDDDAADVNIKVACALINSLGSYLLYLTGALMTTVFCVGPRNIADGEKGPLNPTFWLQLFLQSSKITTDVTGKATKVVLTWEDTATEETHSWTVQSIHIWIRFLLSFGVNGIGFGFLLHILPIQVAGQSTIIGVVFRVVGMIYLADLDDYSITPTFTITSSSSSSHDGEDVTDSNSNSDGTDAAAAPSMMTVLQDNQEASYGSTSNGTDSSLRIDPAQEQRIIDQVVRQVMLRQRQPTGNSLPTTNGATATTSTLMTPPKSAAQRKFTTITHAILASRALAKKKKHDDDDEEAASPLLV